MRGAIRPTILRNCQAECRRYPRAAAPNQLRQRRGCPGSRADVGPADDRPPGEGGSGGEACFPGPARKEVRTLIKVTIDQERCKGCGLCIDACPRKLIALADFVNQKGYHPAQCTDQQTCISCAFCARMCPDSCIRVER